MKSISVGDQGLVLELWEAWESDGRPLLKLRRGEHSLGIHLSEVRHLVAALIDAGPELAVATVAPPEFSD